MKENWELAYEDYLNGMKRKDIAAKYGVSVNTVKSWKSRHWNTQEVAPPKPKKGAPLKNKNALGHGAPKKNKNAEKHGFFSKWLPEETMEIINCIEERNPIDILWDNIQLQYAAIIRAQKLMHVKDQRDKTIEKIEEKENGERLEIQQAWDKHANFMSAQSRAMKTLEGLIKQYDEMLHKNWQLATDEQKARIASLKAKIGDDDSEEAADDGFLEALNSSAKYDWEAFEDGQED